MSLTRRLFLCYGATAAAATAVTAPAVGAPVVEEAIEDRVERLSWELADALNTYRGGNWYAEVHASLPHDHPVGLFRADSRRVRECAS